MKKVFLFVIIFALVVSSYGYVFPSHYLFKLYDKWDAVKLLNLVQEGNRDRKFYVYNIRDILYYEEMKSDDFFVKLVRAKNIYFSFIFTDLFVMIEDKRGNKTYILYTSKLPDPQILYYDVFPIYVRYTLGMFDVLHPKEKQLVKEQ